MKIKHFTKLAAACALLMVGASSQALVVSNLLPASGNGSGWGGQTFVSSQLIIASTADQPAANEWFSRYAQGNGQSQYNINASLLDQFKNAPAQSSAGVGLVAASSTVRVTFLGTGAARDSNLFLAQAGAASFNTAAFWNPVYASGGTNNLGTYNPVNASNALFQTRASCSYAQAKAGNTCDVSQLGMSREISGLTVGSNLTFGLQALPLVYSADHISIPNTNYFFSGVAANNSDPNHWNDQLVHTKILSVGGGAYLVGFEDSYNGGDKDYNDNIFLFQGVTTTAPVPEPASFGLMGLGLLGMGLRLSRRDRRAAGT